MPQNMTEKVPAAQKAVIYCRVSSKKQSTDGAGLESQEHTAVNMRKVKAIMSKLYSLMTHQAAAIL